MISTLQFFVHQGARLRSTRDWLHVPMGLMFKGRRPRRVEDCLGD